MVTESPSPVRTLGHVVGEFKWPRQAGGRPRAAPRIEHGEDWLLLAGHVERIDRDAWYDATYVIHPVPRVDVPRKNVAGGTHALVEPRRDCDSGLNQLFALRVGEVKSRTGVIPARRCSLSGDEAIQRAGLLGLERGRGIPAGAVALIALIAYAV